MEESQKIMFGSAVALALLLGLFATTLVASVESTGNEENFRDLLGDVDDSLESARIGKNPKLEGLKSDYKKITPDNFEGRPELSTLDSQIRSILNKSGISLEDIQDLRGKISEMGSELGFGLSSAFEYAVLVILGISLSASFLATLACRSLISWDRLKEAEGSLKRWSEESSESDKKKSKSKREIKERHREVVRKQERVWSINIKQAGFYLAPFFLLLAWYGYVFSDWTVAWLPFDWFTSGMFESVGVSLTSFGWLIISYFGFAQLWRMALLSKGSE